MLFLDYTGSIPNWAYSIYTYSTVIRIIWQKYTILMSQTPPERFISTSINENFSARRTPHPRSCPKSAPLDRRLWHIDARQKCAHLAWACVESSTWWGGRKNDKFALGAEKSSYGPGSRPIQQFWIVSILSASRTFIGFSELKMLLNASVSTI